MIRSLYTVIIVGMIGVWLVIFFNENNLHHGESEDLYLKINGEKSMCVETNDGLKEILDKVIADTYKELTEDTAEKYHYMKSKNDAISSDELNLQDINPASKLESDEPIANAIEDSRRKKKG